MIRILLVAVGIAAIVAIFLTMPAGRALASRLGLPGLARGGPPREDRQFLLRLCGNDRRQAQELLEAERRKFSELSEAEIYRRVIRSQMRAREEATGNDDD